LVAGDADDKPIDAHKSTFKIGAHIRDAEAALLQALRSHHDDESPSNSNNTTNHSTSIDTVDNDVVSRRLASIHNNAWKHRAVTSREWHERATVDRAWSSSSVLAEYDVVNPSTAPAGDLHPDDLARLDPAVAEVLRSLPKASKLARLVRSMPFSERVAISPVPHHSVLLATAGSTAHAPSVALFGVSVDFVPLITSRWGRVPQIVADCLDWLVASDLLGTVGVFRLSGAANAIQNLHDLYEQGRVERGRLPPSADIGEGAVHVVANLLKLYLRKLPEPLVPLQLYPLFMLIYETAGTNEAALAHALRGALASIRARGCGSLLAALCVFFRDHVAVHAAESSMTCANLAIMIAPSVLRADTPRENAAFEASRVIPSLVTCMIEKSDFIFNGWFD
jgi:hypothetical protein